MTTRRAFLAAGALALAMLGAGCMTAGTAGSRTDALRARLLSGDRSYVFVAMHRGDWRNFPENSKGAILSSIALGADIVELDVARTKDGRFVLMHDESVDRTTTGKGKVGEMTVEELKKLRMTKDGKSTDYEILTLEEALELTRGRILVNIDKFVAHPKEILDAVKAAGALREVLVKADFSPETAKRALGEYWADVESGELLYMPVVQYCWKRHEVATRRLPLWIATEPRRASMYEVCADAPEHTSHFAEVVAAQGGPRLWINTMWDSLCAGHEDKKALLDPEANWGWALRHGATMLQTDYAAEMLVYLNRIGRRHL
ncbi:MAG: glycerophosphodiester phosphodiesterase family protein [Kiritimatiellae bacterium]|nr:glycerophosphodiester phosphodiesterase family protein [Kiritimatiellia bacterium]